MSTATVIPVLDTSLFLLDLRLRRLDGVLKELADFAAGAGTSVAPERLHDALVRRERLYSSAIGKGVAVPHARTFAIGRALTVVARSARGVDWHARDGAPIRLVLAVLVPGDMGLDPFYDRLARAIAAGRLSKHRQRLLAAGTLEQCRSAFAEVLA